jgi:hypothetical protein
LGLRDTCYYFSQNKNFNNHRHLRRRQDGAPTVRRGKAGAMHGQQ